jgi:hypothetical protein
VTVLADSLPVTGARVCATKDDEVYAVGLSDSTGLVPLAVGPETPGALYVTVSGMNLATRTDTLQVLSAAGPVLSLQGLQASDGLQGASQGNADGVYDAGETLELQLELRNQGGGPAYGLHGTVVGLDPRLQVLSDSLAVDSLVAGATAPAAPAVVVHIASETPDGTRLGLQIDLHDDAAHAWQDRLDLVVSAPRPEVTRVVVTPVGAAARTGGPPDAPAIAPTGTIDVEVKNYGSGAQPALWCRLQPPDSSFVVVQDSMQFGPIAALAMGSGAPGLEFADTTAAADVPVLVFDDAYGRSFSLPVDLQPPAAPAVPIADLTYGDGVVRLTWTPSADLDLYGYHVFRCEPPDSTFVRLTPDAILHADYYDTSVVPNSKYAYRIVAVDESRQWSPPSLSLAVNTSVASLPGWPIDMSAPTASSVAVGDLDGDSDLEVVVGDVGVYAWHHDGIEVYDGDGNTTTYGVFSSAPGALNASVALGQMDGQGGLEIVGASWATNQIWVWRADGQLLPGWPREPLEPGNRGYWASPVVADVDGDGGPEVVAISKNGWLYAWHADGTPLLGSGSGAVRNVGAWTQTTPAIADLDGDGDREIVVAGSTGLVYVLQADGSDFPSWPLNLVTLSHCSPAVGDVDHDGTLEIVLTTENNDRIHVLRPDATYLPGWPVLAPMKSPDLGPSVALGDLLGDERLEIVVVSVPSTFTQTKLYVYDASGAVLLTKQLDLNSQSSPILADLDGDGSIDIVHGGEAGILHAWTGLGEELEGFPIAVGDYIRSTPAYCDLDLDGAGDLVFAGWNKRAYAWRMAGPYRPDRAPWPTFHGDMQRTGYAPLGFPTPVAEPPVPNELRADWAPNPFNPSVGLRLDVPPEAAGGGAVAVRVEIFDARGRRLRVLLDEPRLPGEHRLVWDGRDALAGPLPSGIYLYRVQAGSRRLSGKLTLLR